MNERAAEGIADPARANHSPNAAIRASQRPSEAGMSPNCVYVAGSTSDIERVRRAQRICVDVGWAVSFDWTGVEGEIRHD
jgi:hypothetical protein